MKSRPVIAPALAWLATAGLASATALLGVTAREQIEAVRDSGPLADPASVLIAIAAAGATLVAARLSVCAAAAGVALAARRAGSCGAAAARIAVAASPWAMRPALAALLVGGVALAVAAPATAAAAKTAPTGVTCVVATASASASRGPVPDPAPHLPTPGWQSLPAPGWLPSPPRPRPVASAERAPGALLQLVSSGAARRAGTDHELVVRRGDTLWALAARALGPGASAAEIAAEWPHWWQSNRRAIGEDPDLLVPGTRLTAPAAQSTPTEGS